MSFLRTLLIFVFVFSLVGVSGSYAVTKSWCIGINHAWYGTPGLHPIPGAKGFNTCPGKYLNKISFDKVAKYYSSGVGKKHLCNILEGSDFNNPSLKVWFQLAVKIEVKCKKNTNSNTKIVIKEDKETRKLAEQEKQKRIELEKKLVELERKQNHLSELKKIKKVHANEIKIGFYSLECSFDKKPRGEEKFQIHTKNTLGMIFNEKFYKSISYQETKDKIKWSYEKETNKTLSGKRIINYVYHKKNKKINMYTSGNAGVWGLCAFKEYNQLVAENKNLKRKKVTSTSEQEKEKRIKELEKKLAALQSENKKQKKKAKQNEIGSGFYVSKFRHIITNQHVVNQCKKITVGESMSAQIPADLIASDKRNDLAILQTVSMEMASADTKSFVQRLAIKIVPIISGGLMRSEDVIGGEEILVAGFPLGNMVSDTIKVTKGIVSATKGMDNDVSQFEIDAVIRKGNSGGPVYDKRGNIVGVAVSRLNVNRAEYVNFGIKGSTVKQFLSAHDIPTKWSNRQKEIKSKDIYKIASKQTVMVVCHR